MTGFAGPGPASAGPASAGPAGPGPGGPGPGGGEWPAPAPGAAPTQHIAPGARIAGSCRCRLGVCAGGAETIQRVAQRHAMSQRVILGAQTQLAHNILITKEIFT